MDYLPLLTSLTTVLTWLCSSTTDAAQLNDYILDYQPLEYNHGHLHHEHSRVKRSTDPSLRWNFRAYGRTFNVQLSPATSIFTPDHKLDLGGGELVDVDTSFIYEGQLTDNPRSHVHMSILNNSILGMIDIPGHDIYHIEPAVNHFKDPKYPSIIYPESKLNTDPYRHKRSAGEKATCYSDSIFQKLKSMSQPVDNQLQERKRREAYSENFSHNKYSAYYNSKILSRQRRDLIPGNTSCFLNLQADGVLHKHIFDKQNGQEKETKEELVAMFSIHVSAIKKIYSSTIFRRSDDSSVSFSGVTFQLQRSTIMRRDCNGIDSSYCTDNLDVSNFLDLTSLQDHSAFCLVHTFTYRDFIGGTLGLAWVAETGNPNAGVCGGFSNVRDNGVVRQKSLNTGITTLINFNKPIPSRVSQLTLAHEIGHNFGSRHDVTAQCAPYGTGQPNANDGNYIMFPSANQGNLPNNDKFSDCSKDYIAKILETMENNGGRRNYCFKASDTAFCGNNLVEQGEECDCGYESDCGSIDNCCTGRPDDGSESSGMCTRKSSAVCSPSEGACCTDSCNFVSSGTQCQNSTECTEKAYCQSDNATCPVPVNKVDNTTFCNNHDSVCFQGECIGSICTNIGWEECSLTSDDDESEDLCYVSCRESSSGVCISSNDADALNQNQAFKDLLKIIAQYKKLPANDLRVRKPAGSRCNFNKGFCDIESKCRLIDAEGPFKHLTDLIFDPVTLDRIVNWIKDHWWAVLLMAFGAIVLMALFIKIFGYNTPSENPAKVRMVPASDAGGRRGQQANKRSRNPAAASVYATEVPMHDSRNYGSNSGHYNYGYEGHEGAPNYPNYGGAKPPYRPGPTSRHQQFDRISAPPKYY